MKKTLIISLFTIHHSLLTSPQEIPASTEQQLENLTEANEAETEDDAYLQDLEYFRKHPLNLNTADALEIKQLKIITDLQITNLISYRKLFGALIGIYELQAVPAWDLETIRKLLPFITVKPALSVRETSKWFRDGDHSLLLRISQVLEKSKGFDPSVPGTKYLGSPQRVFFRYRYMYKKLLQFGCAGDKDAGEQFFHGAQKKGFDFYSAHLFARMPGIIQSLALGDFTVSMGQGLIQWQGLAFNKSADVMGIKRQASILNPYSSAGEFYFHRGAGITLQKGRTELTAFVSLRKLGGNLVTDTVNHEEFISSFFTSGNHRTVNEIADRNKLKQTSFGGNIIYKGNRWQAGLNGVFYRFSLPVEKRDEPYNLYAVSGRNWHNLSVDYSYTYKNLHVFGEAAIDKNFYKAFINGALISVDPRVDISLLQRVISAGYQTINGNAFTENTWPTNETGYYAGVSIRPVPGWRIDGYADLFKFPWLKYQADAPGYGRDFLIQLTWTPNKQVELYLKFRNVAKQVNQPGILPAAQALSAVTNNLVSIPRQSWRSQVNFKLNSSITIRSRMELLCYNNRSVDREAGFSTFFDIIYKPLLRPYSGILRLQYFETDGYNSRIYAYENDILYSYSVPASFDKGSRYYLVLNYDIGKKLSFWLRWAQTIYRERASSGSGPDEIAGSRRTELKWQARWLF